MPTYTIYNVASGLCLNIYGSNITALSDNQNVTQYSITGATEQKWVLDADVFLYNGPIRSAVDTNFALNIYTTTKNCDVYPISKNTASDYTVTTEYNTDGSYLIKLPSHNLYLTPPSLSQGASIGWAAYTGDDLQKWIFEEIEDVPVVPPVSPIASWNWRGSNGSATAAQTQSAYNAVTGKGATSNFSWRVWNDLCDKVQECLDRAGDSWYTYHGPNGGYTPTYFAARMTSTDKTLTAARFNAVRGNIGSHASTGISPVSKGDKVLGSYFITIADALNDWIDMLNS